MNTIKETIESNPRYAKLIRAVVRRIGKESIQDVNNHGIGGGYGGFTYYKDTTSFFRRHKADILRLAKDMAEQLGEDMLTMVAGFQCLNGDYNETEIAEAIYGDGENVDMVQNALAWFAAEEICRMFDN